MWNSVLAVPRPRLLDARVGRGAGQPRAAAGVLGQRLPRRGASLRRDGVQLHRGHARDPHAPARAPRRRRQPDAPLLHGPVARPGAPGGDRAPLRLRGRLRLRAVGDARTGSIWPRGTRPYGTLGAARQHPELGHVNDARVLDDGRPVAAGGIGELELRNPAIMRGYYEMPEETAAVVVDGWLRTGDLVDDNGDGTFTFVGRKKEVIRRRGENLSPTEVEAALEQHRRRRRGRGRRGAVRPVGGRGEGVPGPGAGRDGRRRRGASRSRRERLAPLQGAALLRGGRRAAAHRRPDGWRSTSCPTERTAAEIDIGRWAGEHRRPALAADVRSARRPPTRSPSPGATCPPRSWAGCR